VHTSDQPNGQARTDRDQLGDAGLPKTDETRHELQLLDEAFLNRLYRQWRAQQCLEESLEIPEHQGVDLGEQLLVDAEGYPLLPRGKKEVDCG
jgi:hypothetical protein